MDISALQLSGIQSFVKNPIERKAESKKAFEAYVQDLSKIVEEKFREITHDGKFAFKELQFPEQEPVEFITWIALGIDVVAKGFFTLSDQLVQELYSKGCKAVEIKLRRAEFSDEKEFLNFWHQHHAQLLTDIVGTLLLGHTACAVTLAELYRAIEKKDDSAEGFTHYVRLKMTVTTLGSLNIDSEESEGWKKVLSDLDGKLPFSAHKKQGDLAVFVASHLVKCDIASLDGKNLKGVFWRKDETYQYGKYLVESSLTSKQRVEHDSNLNAANILSGTLGAALKNPGMGQVYFSAMLDYLNQRKKDLFITSLPANEKVEKDLTAFFEKFQQKITDPSAVTSLDLTGLRLRELPNSFALLSNLTTLILSTNEFKEFPRVLLGLRELKVLVLNGNQLTDIPEEVAKMPQLNRLDILENPIKEVPSTLQKVVWQLPFRASWRS